MAIVVLDSGADEPFVLLLGRETSEAVPPCLRSHGARNGSGKREANGIAHRTSKALQTFVNQTKNIQCPAGSLHRSASLEFLQRLDIVFRNAYV